MENIQTNSNELKTYTEFVANSRLILQNEPIPPSFEPELWKDLEFNCYQYALRIRIDCTIQVVKPGFIFFKNLGYEDYCPKPEILEEYFLADCNSLGLKVRKTSFEEYRPDEYKIIMYYRPCLNFYKQADFHFIRQDSDKGWSDKCGWEGKIKRVLQDEIKDGVYKHEYRQVGIYSIGV